MADDAPSGGSWTTVEPPRSAASVYDAPPGSFASPDFGYYRADNQPTAEQLARDAARRHSLRRNVYLPLALAVGVVILAFVTIALLAFAAPYLGIDLAAARSFIAGLSGLVIIMITAPLIALMSILPLSYLAWRWNRRQNRPPVIEGRPRPVDYGRLQPLLWRVENTLDRIARSSARAGARLTEPLVSLHARADYWQEFARALQRNFGPRTGRR